LPKSQKPNLSNRYQSMSFASSSSSRSALILGRTQSTARTARSSRSARWHSR